MTRAKAEERARTLQAEDLQRDTHEARPRPSHPDDPRTGHEQRVPGFPGGVG